MTEHGVVNSVYVRSFKWFFCYLTHFYGSFSLNVSFFFLYFLTNGLLNWFYFISWPFLTFFSLNNFIYRSIFFLTKDIGLFFFCQCPPFCWIGGKWKIWRCIISIYRCMSSNTSCQPKIGWLQYSYYTFWEST